MWAAMNIVLFEPHEMARPLPLSDRRARHLLQVLRLGKGDEFVAGVINGPRGKARIVSLTEAALELAFDPGETPPPLPPLTLLVGLPRPQTARKLLSEATTLGVAAMHFVSARLSDPNYRQSPLWSTDEWRRHVIEGAQQAGDTRLPDVTWTLSLRGAVETLAAGGTRLGLDNYEASRPLLDIPLQAPVALALGPERGWTPGELETLRADGFELAHLGSRVLRVETAAVSAIALVRAKMGWA